MSDNEDMARGRRWCVCALGALVVAAGALAACNGQTGDTADASTGDGGSGDTGGPGNDAGYALGDCGPSAGLAGYATAASGTVVGPGVSAALCGAEAYLFQSRYSMPSGDYLFYLDSTTSSSIELQSPAGASDALLTGMMQVSTPAPGVYRSSDATSCGFLSFSYALPVPAGVDCGDNTVGPDCPPGCGSACSGLGCEPCTPQQPEVDYGASAASDCLGDTQPVAGSWTVTLTSVVPYEDDAGANENGPHYTTHGTVTATLPDEEGGTDTVTLTMGF
jgi:hypothetical protein